MWFVASKHLLTFINIRVPRMRSTDWKSFLSHVNRLNRLMTELGRGTII